MNCQHVERAHMLKYRSVENANITKNAENTENANLLKYANMLTC